MRRRGRGIRLQFGYSSICRLAVRAGLENEMLERLRVVQPLGGVEDFDAGEAVGAPWTTCFANAYGVASNMRISISSSMTLCANCKPA